jgi:hypothetical protein
MFNKKNCLTASLLLATVLWASNGIASQAVNVNVIGIGGSQGTGYVCCVCLGDSQFFRANISFMALSVMDKDELAEVCANKVNKLLCATKMKSSSTACSVEVDG